ncbi:hypothetical protein HDV05_002653, partial [Chytridiales sp. JEL 0842]
MSASIPREASFQLTVTPLGSQEQTTLNSLSSNTSQSTIAVDVRDDDGVKTTGGERHKAPHLSLWDLFVLFLGFGINAWGGAVAQIQLIQEKLVKERKWITHVQES